MRAALAAYLAMLAAPVAASDLRLALPVDCILGETCFIQHHVDHDPGPEASDYTCGALTYDGHKGTDFRLASRAAMISGVPVRAAATGTVTALRDGMADDGTDPVGNRDCGNGIVMSHPDGWETQYCHMKAGSITVTEGMAVDAGTPLGEIGLSGKTQFPHLHLSVRKNGAVVDPFAPDTATLCGSAPSSTLWVATPPYTPGGLLNAGFAAAVPTYPEVRAGTASVPALPADTPALVLWGFAFGGLEGDVLLLRIIGPDGAEITSHKAVLPRNQAQFFRAAGRKIRGAAWPPGTYTGTLHLIRNGRTLDTLTTQIPLN